MSWYRKVKSMYSISFVTISFIIWSTLSKWLFENLVDYKLFLITLCTVFFTQYLNSVKLKKNLFILVILGLNIVMSSMFFKGQIIFINTIFLLFMALITYSLEDSPIDYSQYKEDINKSMVVLVFIWMISFTLGSDFVNAMYRFHVLYIIMIIILMRETRRYIYSVKSNTSIVTNIIIGISVLTLSLDFANKIIAKVLDMLIKLAGLILVLITSLLTTIFGVPMSFISEMLRKLILRRNISEPKQNIINGNLNKQQVVSKYQDINIPPSIILIFKILILLLILYVIYKFLSRFRNKTRIYNGFVEEKERIVKEKDKKHWVKNLFGKIFRGGESNRDKILHTYKGFEKITEQADIYKPYMTASQLKNVTKINVDNSDNLDEMTLLYNEAKFSLHTMTQENVESVRKGHSNIKKQL
ncbi:hypothetical protein LGL55_05565 [Clostridium tagluense]|uniref:hypothetical protein n=1 Tax=Clostridium tagluense TaxID=360422 RepID=UPI001C0CC8CF|nr:hypothetical protein [Clostridium tagluense]MBU3126914.1 hypothetical protein [Clostridium tagluense]MCB2310589.1 hypothetical protein [Clostridium tagluense]MCB2315245.1 hypothetical protein [Clostridium tagluense]MCB2320096.1 hypothetical protein [Clostridium tagluense]MCB2324987.1 hypothetical protein [Clostridium tagluense]